MHHFQSYTLRWITLHSIHDHEKYTWNCWFKFAKSNHMFETTLNYWMMAENYPNLKEDMTCRPWNLLYTWQKKTCQVVNCVMCFDADTSAFCYLIKRRLQFKYKGSKIYMEWRRSLPTRGSFRAIEPRRCRCDSCEVHSCCINHVLEPNFGKHYDQFPSPTLPTTYPTITFKASCWVSTTSNCTKFNAIEFNFDKMKDTIENLSLKPLCV